MSTLSYAISINPWDIEATARKIHDALRTPQEKRIEKYRAMIHFLKNYTATDWAQSFIKALKKTRRYTSAIPIPIKYYRGKISLPLAIKQSIEKTQGVAIFTDYDG